MYYILCNGWIMTNYDNNTLKIQHEQTRRKVWADVWIATASVFNVRETAVATSWADKCLAAYDERFKAQEVFNDNL
jgi:hypothetical protein